MVRMNYILIIIKDFKLLLLLLYDLYECLKMY